MSLLGRNAWNWATGSPEERGEMVRRHVGGTRPLPRENLKLLFDLTDEGLDKIMNGDCWRPEYEAPAVNYI